MGKKRNERADTAQHSTTQPKIVVSSDLGVVRRPGSELWDLSLYL